MNFPGAIFVPKSGALGGIRTHDLCLRRAALYPLSYKRIKIILLSPLTSKLSADNFTGAEGGI